MAGARGRRSRATISPRPDLSKKLAGMKARFGGFASALAVPSASSSAKVPGTLARTSSTLPVAEFTGSIEKSSAGHGNKVTVGMASWLQPARRERRAAAAKVEVRMSFRSSLWAAA
jgi:hypothetical protein